MQSINKYMPLSPSARKTISDTRKIVKALEKEDLGTDGIAKRLKEQVECEKPYYDQEKEVTRDIPDNSNRSRALDMVIKIVDLLPSTKHEIEENRNINIHITTDSAERAVEAANQEVIDISEWSEGDSEFLD